MERGVAKALAAESSKGEKVEIFMVGVFWSLIIQIAKKEKSNTGRRLCLLAESHQTEAQAY